MFFTSGFDVSIWPKPLVLEASNFILGLLLPNIAVAARRLHDIDKTGWLQLIQIIPLIGGIILIIWCATEGTKKKNKYGKPIKIKR